jgi:hypothetical protein
MNGAIKDPLDRGDSFRAREHLVGLCPACGGSVHGSVERAYLCVVRELARVRAVLSRRVDRAYKGA